MSQYFKTISEPNEAYLYKEKKSKFYGHAFPLSSKEALVEKINLLKERYSNANHFCYAWQIGVNEPIFKLNESKNLKLIKDFGGYQFYKRELK